MISGISSNLGLRANQARRSLSGAQAVEPVRPVAPRPGATEMPPEERRGQQSAAVVSFSDEARALAARGAGVVTEAKPGVEKSSQASESEAEQDPSKLSEEEQAEVKELQKRDAEVRTHEQAHKAVGGQYAGAIHYDTQRGPDGASYAVGGHVNIDVSEVRDDPAATIAKMQQVVRAALAPANPSSADRSVAASANSKAAEARRELAEDSGATGESGAGLGAPSQSTELGTEVAAAAQGTAAAFGLSENVSLRGNESPLLSRVA